MCLIPTKNLNLTNCLKNLLWFSVIDCWYEKQSLIGQKCALKICRPILSKYMIQCKVIDANLRLDKKSLNLERGLEAVSNSKFIVKIIFIYSTFLLKHNCWCNIYISFIKTFSRMANILLSISYHIFIHYYFYFCDLFWLIY